MNRIIANKIWPKIVAVLIMEFFMVGQVAYALSPDDKYQGQKSFMEDSSQSKESSVQVASLYVVESLPSLGAGSKNMAQENIQEKMAGETLEGLTVAGTGLEDKAKIAKNLDCSVSQAANMLMSSKGGNHGAGEVSAALKNAGYDPKQVDNYLSNVAKSENNIATISDQPAINISAGTAENSSVASVISSGSNNVVVANSASVSQPDQNQTSQNNNLTTNNSVSAGYQDLVDSGLTSEQAVLQLKESGVSSTDVLKSATEAGADMTQIAKAMLSAGYTTAEVAQAFVSKALDWAGDKAVNFVNCAVESLSEVLSGQKSISSGLIDLAYEVIVADVLQTGSVNIQGGQIMSSMSAIQKVAADHGVSMEGYQGTFADLSNVQGSAIVHLDGDHWATVKSVNADNVVMVDNGNTVTISKAEFESRWDGNILVDQSKNSSATQKMTALDQQQMTMIQGASWGGGENSSGGDNGYGGGSENSGGSEGNGGGSWGGSENSTGGPNGYGGSESSLGESSGFGGFCDSVSEAVSGFCGAVSEAMSDIGNAISGAVSGFCGAVSEAVSDIGNSISTAVNTAIDSWGNMSTLGKIGCVAGTVVGIALGAPALGIAGGLLGDTVTGMIDGKSLGQAVSDAFGNSLAGKALNAVANTVAEVFSTDPDVQTTNLTTFDPNKTRTVVAVVGAAAPKDLNTHYSGLVSALQDEANVVAISYDYTAPQDKIAQDINTALSNFKAENPEQEVSVVAHSYGTQNCLAAQQMDETGVWSDVSYVDVTPTYQGSAKAIDASTPEKTLAMDIAHYGTLGLVSDYSNVTTNIDPNAQHAQNMAANAQDIMSSTTNHLGSVTVANDQHYANSSSPSSFQENCNNIVSDPNNTHVTSTVTNDPHANAFNEPGVVNAVTDHLGFGSQISANNSLSDLNVNSVTSNNVDFSNYSGQFAEQNNAENYTVNQGYLLRNGFYNYLNQFEGRR